MVEKVSVKPTKTDQSISDNLIFLDAAILKSFVRDVFIKLKVPSKDAEIIADVLISSDLRGIDSHGIQRCRMYYERIKQGIYNPKTDIEIIKDEGATAVIDGKCGMGQIIGYKAMKLAIEKARKFGVGAVAVRNSTHFGFAGYYSLMAIREGMIGFTTTNARPAVPPTFGVEPMLGTNPLTYGAPTDEEFPFIIDCATSIIQRGKVEVYNRIHKPLPNGVIITKDGNSETDPEGVLHDLGERTAALLPLGGKGESTSGYKGYGYATFAEILSAALQDGVYLKDTAGVMENGQLKLKVGHFFLAINIKNFIPLDRFQNITGNIMRELRSSKKAPGAERIYTAGEKEYIDTQERLETGIPLTKSVQEDIKIMQQELSLYNYKFAF
ncbi:MAG: Ldh family oxidoreductase [Candidatus Lokiarchaeota archaeon]|nr:Ldh family oxidoreductase [Candidatus Lokiarchaeota archaeon]